MKLVIVESPTKAKKISGILGPGYLVRASFGHIRDLPLGPLANSIAIQGDTVTTTYEVMDKSTRAVKELKEASKNAEITILATDPDREGEAIAWHLEKVLKLKDSQRATFHSIDEKGVMAGMAGIRKIHYRLVDAQQTRRVLDRCVGWIVSGLLRKGLNDNNAKSAGRVQSVALRMVVDREREIQGFVKKSFFVVIGEFIARPIQPKIKAELFIYEGRKVEQTWVDQSFVQSVVDRCKKSYFRVLNIEHKAHPEKPPPPFITSTVQMAASKCLRISPKATMEGLQRLFENGHITYHRTDSPFVVPEAIEGARQWIAANLPKDYLPSQPYTYAAKDGAQEAHEAIRPTHWEKGPDVVQGEDGPLYTMIWRRFIASQVAECRSSITNISIETVAQNSGNQAPFAIFVAKGRHQIFDGWRRIMDADKPQDDEEDEKKDDTLLPNVEKGAWLTVHDLKALARQTKPPERYTQAKLIEALEKNGIGRPSSYATIMETIIDNGYVNELKRKLHASDLGCRITDFLVQNFQGDFIDKDFTKRIEETLDLIAQGKTPWQPFAAKVANNLAKKAMDSGLPYNPLLAPPEKEKGPPCPKCHKPTVKKEGPRGPFWGCSHYPKCNGGMDISSNGNAPPVEAVKSPAFQCPICQKPMVEINRGKFHFLGCSGYPNCNGTRNLDGTVGRK